MRIGGGEHTYDWDDGWAKFGNPDGYEKGWSHHGVVVTDAGDVVTLHHGDMKVVVFDKNGSVLSSWDLGLNEAHGITLVKENGTEYLWIADNGRKRLPGAGFEYPEGMQVTGQVVKKTLDGETVMTLEKPDLLPYRDGDYMPTWVAVNEERHGGNGDVWVADGYGLSQVHRFDRAGGYLGSIDGEEGTAGRFDCPHAIFIDRRKDEAELYVADRGNGRVQVYGLEGSFKRVFGSDFLTSPSGFVSYQDNLVIAELRARLTVVDIDDRPVAYLGDNEPVADVPGWPNNLDESGQIIPSKLLEAGKFNSPHGMAVDADGNLYVAEWLIGGRFVKLTRS